MPVKVWLRSVDMDEDRQSVNVRFEIVEMRKRQIIQMGFKVKLTGSLDQAVKAAEEQLRTFAEELRKADVVRGPPPQIEDRQ
jgi:hypothetical protein